MKTFITTLLILASANVVVGYSGKAGKRAASSSMSTEFVSSSIPAKSHKYESSAKSGSKSFKEPVRRVLMDGQERVLKSSNDGSMSVPYILFSGKAHKHKSHISVSAKAGKSAGGQQSVYAVSTTIGDASTTNSADSSVASIASGKAGKSSRRLLDIGSDDLDCESMSFVLVSEVSAKSAKPRVVSAKSLKPPASTVIAKSGKKTIPEGASQEEVEMSNDEGKVSLDVASKSSKATPALRFIEPQKAQSYLGYTRAKAPVAGVKDESSSAVSVESLLAFAVPIIGAMFV